MSTSELQPVVRKLGTPDWKSMSRLRSMCTTHAGATVSAVSNTPLTGVATMYQWEPNCAFGTFKDEKLSSYICCYAQPDFWVLDLMVSSGDPNDLRACLEQCLQHFEARGVYCFYYAFPAKWARAYRRFWREGAPSLRKYEIQDLAYVEKKKRPADPWIWEHILHNQVVNVNLQLRRSICSARS